MNIRCYSQVIFMMIMLMIALPSTAYAHSSDGSHGMLSGFIHPLLGIDHLIAMVAVGVLSAQIGGRAIWYVPWSFVLAMIMGFVMGINHTQMFLMEYGIALSVVFLGMALAMDKKMPIWISIAFVGMFGIYHGNAHGLEMMSMTDPFQYAIGFVVTTMSLHVMGVWIGLITLNSLKGSVRLRFSGIIVTLIGILLFTQL